MDFDGNLVVSTNKVSEIKTRMQYSHTFDTLPGIRSKSYVYFLKCDTRIESIVRYNDICKVITSFRPGYTPKMTPIGNYERRKCWCIVMVWESLERKPSPCRPFCFSIMFLHVCTWIYFPNAIQVAWENRRTWDFAVYGQRLGLRNSLDWFGAVWLVVCVRTWHLGHDLIQLCRDMISTNHSTDNMSRSNWIMSGYNFHQSQHR